ncbi:hypothetical protein MD484_g7948, partial [Candolleomyces efflorescens]
MAPERSSANLSNNSPLLGGTPNQSVDNNLGNAAPRDGINEKQPSKGRKRWLILAIVLGIAIIVFLAIFLPVYFVVIRKSPATEAGSSASASSGVSSDASGATVDAPAPSATSVPTTGGDGSIITLENGTTFTYRNSFGGFWVHDPADPFNNNARPNEWTPPLNTSWRWGVDRVYGVNLGGWLVMEPFISPEIFQRYPGVRDEFSLSQAMAADAANGGLSQIEEHYQTFITEVDIAEIAAAGLNFLRVPIGFWAIETWDGEPYLAKTSWTYFLRAIEWARKYGLRILLDLHAVPGSQNGLNHSGKLGTTNFLAGNMGIANAERTLDNLRVFTQFISQPQYRDVVVAIGLVNEPMASQIGLDPLHSFNLRAYDIIRSVTGFGEGNGPYIAVQDGLQNLGRWDGILPGGDRVIMDGHAYFAFGDVNPSPMVALAEDGLPGGSWPAQACRVWGLDRSNIGPTVSGEFSGAPNDCGLFIRAVNVESFHPQCAEYNDWENYNSTMKAGLQNWIMASFDAFGDFFFWTWKIGPSQAGRVQAPLWSYKLGLDNGWIPRDPRDSVGKCAAVGVRNPVQAAYSARYPWPPTSIPSADLPISLLPTFTNTAAAVTLPVPTYTSAPASATADLDGWFNDGDRTGGVVTVAGCPYPNAYTATFATVPTAACTGS